MINLSSRSGILVMVVAVVVLIAAVGMIVSRFTGEGESNAPNDTGRMAWYQDLATGERFRADALAIPPITSPAGHPAARVYLYKRASGEEFVGYFEKYTDQAKQRIEEILKERAVSPDQAEAIMGLPVGQSRLVSVDGSNWLPAADPNAQRAIDKNLTDAEGQKARPIPGG